MTLKWWQKAVFYQIYPRSFADGNGDGIGDFKGITEKLDYLKDLGVDAVWLSPHFPSPNWDWGYDVSDYCNVAPEYGTLDDFRVFLSEAHARDIKVILDLVLNHTSHEHPWFIESKSSRNNPKADWYVWQDTPPNNWQSVFDGDAWTYIPERNQYYYHFFMKEQPDLNWRNPEVVQAIWSAVRFWLDMGVDGYRLDAVGTIYEDPALTPHSLNMSMTDVRDLVDKAQTEEDHLRVHQTFSEMYKYQVGQPGLHELMKELRSVLDEYPGDRMLVGEDDNPLFMGNGEDELQLVFNFPLMNTEFPLTPTWIRDNQEKRLSELAKISPSAWPCNTFGNHDNSYVYSRYADGIHDAERARLALAVVLTLKGTPFLYNGEEIGMTNYIITDPAQVRDTPSVWYYNHLVNELKMDSAEAMKRVAPMTRDRNRTPVQWSNSANAGFCPANITPWLPVNPNYTEGINVRDQQSDPLSLLSFYKRMLRLRKSTPALIEGDYTAIHTGATDYLAYIRSNDSQSILVLLSFSSERKTIHLSDLPHQKAHTLFSSAGRSKTEESLAELHLGAFEIFIAELK